MSFMTDKQAKQARSEAAKQGAETRKANKALEVAQAALAALPERYRRDLIRSELATAIAKAYGQACRAVEDGKDESSCLTPFMSIGGTLGGAGGQREQCVRDVLYRWTRHNEKKGA